MMGCFSPLLAVDNGVNQETGKRSIKIVKHPEWDLARYRERYGDNLMMLPCGHCVGCAQDYARMWQARIMAEAQYHDKKCFLTLTYAKNPPKKPLKDHLRHFIKDVRNKFGSGIKFFGCGEKGELTERSHYHLILFGVDFSEDRKPIQKRGLNILYSSPLLESLWTFGFSSIGSLDVESAAYVSKYCNKKKMSFLDSGEFVIMSRGLGKQYFLDNNVFDSDFIYFEGNKFKLPRYYLKLAEKGDLGTLVDLWNYKDRKRERAASFRYGSSRSFSLEDLCMIEDEKVKLDQLKSKEVVRDVIY